MPFYSSKSNFFLRESKDFILQKYGDRLHETVILVPNVYAANQLSKCFISNREKTGLIPKIIPLEEIKIVSDSIVSLDKRELAHYFEQQLIIANILVASSYYNFNARQSLDLSKSILVLLHEFIKSRREPQDLASLNCEHFLQLDVLAAFFQDVKDKWMSELSKNFVSDVVQMCVQNCQQLSLLIQERRLSSHLILVGIDSPFAYELAQNMHNAGFDILVASFHQEPERFSADFSNLLKMCDATPHDVSEIVTQECGSESQTLRPVLSYQVFLNEIKELNFIIDLLLSKTQEKDCSNVAVVIDDLETTHTLVSTLKGYDVNVKNLVGLSLARNITIDFLLLIGKLQSENALVKDLIALLQHSYFEKEIVERFEHFIIEGGLILQSLQDIISLLKDQFSEIYQICVKAFFFEKELLFCNLLTEHFKAAQRLFPGIWMCREYLLVQEYLSNLLTAARHFAVTTGDAYYDILTKLLQGKFYENSSEEFKVTILSPKDVIFLESQFVIVPNFQDESWPSLGDSDIWLSRSIRSELGLSDVRSDQLERYRCYFATVCNFPKVLFTRSSKVAGKETIESRFLSKIYS
jgi:inactivated superfamily I helicase